MNSRLLRRVAGLTLDKSRVQMVRYACESSTQNGIFYCHTEDR